MESVKTVALFTSVIDGGTWRYVKEMVEQWRKQNLNILLIREKRRILFVDFWSADRHDSFVFPYAEDMKYLCKLLCTYQVNLIHFQHTLDTELRLLRLPELLGIPYVVTLHDYYLICPFIKLTNDNDTYCGENGINDCQKCLSNRNFYSKSFGKTITDITFWRRFWGEFIQNAAVNIVPNQDVKTRFIKYFPEGKYRIIENPELIHPMVRNKRSSSENDGFIHVGVIGILSVAKGRNVLLDCARLVQIKKLPVQFTLFGELAAYKDFIPETLKVLGRYKEEEIYSLIEKENIDFFWFPAVWPETYSYTLSIPIRAGITVIGTNLGAIGERIHRHHWGITYDYDSPPEKIVEKLLDFSAVKNQYRDLIITNTTYPEAADYYQVKIDKTPVTLSNDKMAELRKEESWECNHSNLQHLKGWELKKLMGLSTNYVSKVRYMTRVDPAWAYQFLMTHSLKFIIKKIVK